MSEREEARSNGRVLFGLAIVLIGEANLIQRNAHWAIHLDIRWWPFLLMFLGLAKMAIPGEN